ncbi:diadenosine tetraphosphate hydrolase [Corynebacterium yudongzhengii]|uniref:HIT domain-containing protein n=1 Tax=Corynebacterium yudongzhengii TaxID=2080740 RepID=A0A2U1T505_9CORY|nr:HIT domain-containing protein [Corynebacterium yudongzhengii]AWB81790.1 diadenosine tetraphosphate hydrolase [Corynebacterium yudongzhengii]PWC01055.1 HIT domain-containing protein [Corynebacterium yudongzhengii]
MRSEENSHQYVDTGIGTPDRLARLWAPYRASYLTKQPSTSENKPRDPFVAAPQKSDEEALIIARGESVYALLNLYPYNAGHLMVVPYRKTAELEDLTEAESTELMAFAQKAVRVIKRVSHPEAINVGFNLGRASGGSIGDHLHMHVVPRWQGDSNFMTVLDNTKVLPMLLSDTRRLLAEEWATLDAEDGAERA